MNLVPFGENAACEMAWSESLGRSKSLRVLYRVLRRRRRTPRLRAEQKSARDADDPVLLRGGDPGSTIVLALQLSAYTSETLAL